MNEEASIETDKCNEIARFIVNSDVGEYYYLKYFVDEFKITVEQFILVMELLIRMGVAEKTFKIYCPACKEIFREVYTSLSDIETQLLCDYCDYDLDDVESIKEMIIIFYRRISHE